MFNLDNYKNEIKAVKQAFEINEGRLDKAAQDRIRNLVLRDIAVVKAEPKVYFWSSIKFYHQTFLRYAVVAMAGILVMGGTAFASSNALPGDTLYPVKRLKEQIQLGLAFSSESKADVKEKIAETRILELETIAQKIPEAGDPKRQTGQKREVSKEIKIDAAVAVKSAIESLEKLKSGEKDGEKRDEVVKKIQNKIDNLKARAEVNDLDEEKIEQSGEVKGAETKREDRTEKKNQLNIIKGKNKTKNFKGRLQGEGAVKLDSNGSAIELNVSGQAGANIQGDNSNLQNGEDSSRTQPQDEKDWQGQKSGKDDSENEIENWLNRELSK